MNQFFAYKEKLNLFLLTQSFCSFLLHNCMVHNFNVHQLTRACLFGWIFNLFHHFFLVIHILHKKKSSCNAILLRKICKNYDRIISLHSKKKVKRASELLVTSFAVTIKWEKLGKYIEKYYFVITFLHAQIEK